MNSGTGAEGMGLRLRRVANRLSQDEVARAAGVSRGTISRSEQLAWVPERLARRHRDAVDKAVAVRRSGGAR